MTISVLLVDIIYETIRASFLAGKSLSHTCWDLFILILARILSMQRNEFYLNSDRFAKACSVKRWQDVFPLTFFSAFFHHMIFFRCSPSWPACF